VNCKNSLKETHKLNKGSILGQKRSLAEAAEAFMAGVKLLLKPVLRVKTADQP
jgi:hypothetical protein